MRDSEKNKTALYYALRNIKSEKDEWGNTKDVTTYGNPRRLKISVSANKGEASAAAFGADIKYDREMITHDMTCPIDEFTRLWIDEPSIIDENAITVHGVGDTIHIDGIVEKIWAEGDTIYIENDVLLKADESGFSVSGTKAHNYEVVAVSKSLNCIRYAIRKVNVSK